MSETPMKHILVPTDFSPASKAAFRYAREQVEQVGASSVKVTLLAVLEDLVPASVQFEFGLTFIDTKGLLEEAERQSSKKIAELAEKFFGGLTVDTHVLRAVHPVHTEIVDFVKKNKVNMIVMATHGRTGIRRFVLGSVTEKVVREAPCPVLVVPAE